MPNHINGLYEFGPFRVDASKRLLSRSGEPITLAPKTFDLLLLLVQSEGRVLTKSELMSSLWADTFVEEASLSYQIASLRKALGDRAEEWIETVPKHGYRLTPAILKAPGTTEEHSEGIERVTSVLAIRQTAPWTIAAVAVLLLTVVSIAYFRKTAPSPKSMRFTVLPPEGTNFTPSDSHALSPDGEQLAFTATRRDGKRLLYVRSLDSLFARSLPETEAAYMPFWSPDSRFIAFTDGQKLKRIDTRGGGALPVCSLRTGSAGSWNRDGTILFTTVDKLYRVPAIGGQAAAVTKLDSSRDETFHLYPQFLPDGRHFIYFAWTQQGQNNGANIGLLDSQESKRLLSTNSQAVYSAPSPGMPGPGYLIFVRGNTLMAQPFNIQKREPSGELSPLADSLETLANENGVGAHGAAFSISENGILAFRQAGAVVTELVWLDRNGKRLGTVGEPADYSNPALSPDDKKLAVGRMDLQTKTRDIWIFDLERSASSRFTFDPADDLNPTWSPDGSRIAFTSARKGHRDIYQKFADGTGQEELLVEGTRTEPAAIDDWTEDAKTILFSTADNIWMAPVAGKGKPSPLLERTQWRRNSQSSPNGRWIAYSSNESGRFEVYVESFPPSRGKWQISIAGGDEPRWRRDGKELFYVATDNRLMAVDVNTESAAFQMGIPKLLFELRPAVGVQIVQRTPVWRRNHYVVASNGQRFLTVLPLETRSSPITVVTNWMAALKR